MKEMNMTFNEELGKYELGGTTLSCGTCLEVFYGNEWLKCRVEYNTNWNRGYYLLVFREGINTGSIPLWDIKKGRWVAE